MATKTATLEMLGAVPLFESLSKRELRELLGAAKEVVHGPDHTIVRRGESGVGFHLILTGKAHVVVNGRRRATLGPGDYFGDISLIDGGPRTADVRSVEELRALCIPTWSFRPLLDRNPSIAKKLLFELCRRLRAIDDDPVH